MDFQPIRSAVLSRYPELISSVRRVNKDVRDELKTTHFLNFCKLPISKKELFKYLDTAPNKYGFFDLIFIPHIEGVDHIRLESKLTVSIPPIGSSTNYGLMKSYNQSRVFMDLKFYYSNEGSVGESANGVSRNQMIEKLKETSREYSEYQTLEEESDNITHDYFIDILSYYKIIKKRISCYEIDPNYAKNRTKEYFVNILALLYDSNAEDIKRQSINLVDLYLNVNAYILNIEFPDMLNYDKIRDYDQFMMSTQDERQKVIDNIYAAINNF